MQDDEIRKTVVVTGATGAIGKEIARSLVRQGAYVVLACRSLEKGKGIADELNGIHANCAEVLYLDLSDTESVRNAARALSPRWIDALINNAGVMNATFRMDSDGHEDTLNVNYHNTRLLTELLLPNMRQGGVVVFTTSATRSWFPSQRLVTDITADEFGRLKTYSLSKKLITAYAGELADELSAKDCRVRVNCADPGVVDTPMLRMGKWFDRIADVVFRPFCLSPARGAKGALNAYASQKTGKVHTPFGCVGEIKRRKIEI